MDRVAKEMARVAKEIAGGAKELARGAKEMERNGYMSKEIVKIPYKTNGKSTFLEGASLRKWKGSLRKWPGGLRKWQGALGKWKEMGACPRKPSKHLIKPMENQRFWASGCKTNLS